MNYPHSLGSDFPSALALFEPAPDTLYSLDHVSQLLALSRRWIAICARHGLVHPVFDPLVEGWYFDAAAIQTLRRIEYLRAMHRLDLLGIKLVLELMREVETLRAEVRFLRGR
jgi:hypothetical protein